mgnify:CR=1 FL=1
MNKAQIVAIALMLSGCYGSGQYRQVLDRAERQNTAFDSITGIDSLLLAAEYMDRHGTANEQVRAHYLLGCAYRDAAEAPMALEAFHDAADRADTTRHDCDYGLLMRLHAQMAELLYSQQLPYEMLEELAVQQRYALRIGDEKGAINVYERCANAYYLLNEPDSVIAIRREASTRYQRLGLHAEAAQALGPIIDLLIDRGDTAEARRCIARYERESGVFKDGEPISRKAHNNYSKGRYYLAVGRTDSAQILFRRLLQPGQTPQQLEAGYRGLFLLYQGTGQKDSMAKYADLCYQQSMQSLAASNSDNLRHMQSLYNYSRSQKQAQQMTVKAHRQARTLYAVFTLSAILLILGIAAWLNYRRGQQKKIAILRLRYEQEKENMKKTQKDMRRLNDALETKEANFNELMKEKKSEIRLHQERIQDLETKLKIRENRDVNTQLLATPIYRHFKHVLTTPKARITKGDWQELQDMIDEVIPVFYGRMNSQRQSLSTADYQICILVRLFFAPKEIAYLTGNTAQAISMKRMRLLNKIFGIDGAAETFDKLIQRIN